MDGQRPVSTVGSLTVNGNDDRPTSDGPTMLQQIRLKGAFSSDLSDEPPMIPENSIHPLNPTKSLRAFTSDQETLLCGLWAFDQVEDFFHRVQINGRMFYLSDDESIRLIRLCKNIDDAKQRKAVLHEIALRDNLTRLYNKLAFKNRDRVLLRDALRINAVANRRISA